MSRRGTGAVFLLTAILSLPCSADGQTSSPAAQAAPGALKVFLTCSECDRDHLRTALPFLAFVEDAAGADVQVVATTAAAGAETRWTLTMTGAGSHRGQNRVSAFGIASAASVEELRADLARFLALALAPYAAASGVGPHMDVTFKRPGTDEAAARKDEKDPWNYWVFRIGGNMYQSGEQTTSNSSYGVNANASRTTDNWKMRFSASRSLNKSSFDIDDLTIRTRLTDWNVDTLVVKSLGRKWSWGFTSSLNGSTFSNAEMVGRFSPGLEYDIFPYAESSRRSLTIQYTVGYAHYEYQEVTIFDRIQEDVAEQVVNATLGLRQPWGSTGASFVFSQQLTSRDRTRLSANGSFNVRLRGSLSVNGSASYARIRDLFTLQRGGATDEEVLLRLRQLDTGFRYSFNLGFSYAFGALSNTTVNPRFGG